MEIVQIGIFAVIAVAVGFFVIRNMKEEDSS